MQNWICELWQYRELFLAFVIKEIKIRYKQTLFGFAWAILQPAALTLIFTLVFSIFLNVDSGRIPYPVFAYSALLPWSFFTSAISFGSLSVVNNSSLVTRVYFPREIMPLSSIGAAFFDFLIAFLIFIILLIFYKVPINTNILYILPITFAILVLTSGISLILTALNVLFRDIRFIIPLALQVLMYLTPIVYSVDQVPEKYRPFLFLNPLTILIEDFRNVTAYGEKPNLLHLGIYILVALLFFIVGYYFFKRKEKIFADVI